MTRDEYLQTAENALAVLRGPGDINANVLSGISLAAIACLLMVAQMDRDVAAKPQPAGFVGRTDDTVSGKAEEDAP